MNKKQFMKVIREVVRKEVQKEVKKIFITEQKKSKVTSKPITEKQPVKKEYKKKHYTDNKSLNDILNETANSPKEGMEEYPTMGGSTLDSTNMVDMLGYGDMGLRGGDSETQRKVAAVQTMKEAGVSSEQVPESLVNALTRDYSDLMKHDKMKGK